MSSAPADSSATAEASEPPRAPRHRGGLLLIAGFTVAVLAVGGLLISRAARAVNRTTLTGSPRPVTAVYAQAAEYQKTRDYIGAVDSWIEATVGPQYVSAYAQTVLVRPGDRVKRGQVLATLDCSNPNASSRAIDMQARAVDARRRFAVAEAARVESLLDGGFVALNEVDQKSAQRAAEEASLLETKAKALAAELDVRDCVLRAPFDGDVATRSVDPGAFVERGAPIVSVVDRSTVRVVVDAPEKDFELLDVSTPVRITMLATGAEVRATVSRRAPKADPSTRTVRFEVDVPDPQRRFPTATTAIVHIDVGSPVSATQVPLYAATQRGDKARIFVVERGIAHSRDLAVLGEQRGLIFFKPHALPEHTLVVTEGRALLSDGDPVSVRVEQPHAPADTDGGTDTRGGGFGRPL